MLSGLENESIVSAGTFPVAWRMEIVQDERYRGCEYVRYIFAQWNRFELCRSRRLSFFWGSTNMAWDLRNCGSGQDRTPVRFQS